MRESTKHDGQTAREGRAAASVTESDASSNLSPATGSRHTRAYVGSDRGSDADLTVPRQPSGRVALPSAPHWHVHLELRPEELVALHRAGYTSGALAWREGMEGWQPLRPDSVPPEKSDTGPAGGSERGPRTDAEQEAGEDVEVDLDDSTTDSGERAARDESSVTENPRRGFLFTRGRRLTAPNMTLFPLPVVRDMPASAVQRPAARAMAVVSAPLPAFSDDPAAPPPSAYTPPPQSAFYPQNMGSMDGAAARALPPVPVPPPDGTGRFAARAPAYRAQAKPASLPPPTVLELPAARSPLVSPRSLWIGACALAALSACIGAVVSSVMWTMQGGDERAATGVAARGASETSVAAVPKKIIVADSVAPRKESVSVEELPLLGAGQRPEAVRTEARASAGSALAPAAEARREAARSPRATRRSGSAAERPEAGGPVERGPADMKDIVSAVAHATRAARSCGDSPQSGRVSLTFSPSGAVASVSLDKAFGDRDVNSCVLRAMSRARVSAFVGAPVSVRKSLTW